MNFLSPDDIFSGMRRKSLCNGALLALSTQHGSKQANGTDSANSTPNKSKKERRRGSFNEATTTMANNGGSGSRRSSLVSRWFKHISDAAEQYKPRSKNANHEPVDDPAIATLPHSNTKESLELTPERPPPISATATVTTTPLAPMISAPHVHSPLVGGNGYNDAASGVQLRNGRRESTPTSSAQSINAGADGPAYQNIQHRQAMSHHTDQLSPAVNRTMSTRSCGEADHHGYANTEQLPTNGVTLRHTQSARQASSSTSNNENGDGGAAAGAAAGVVDGAGNSNFKRDSASIVYSNNSNNTRTLMQSSPPLVQPNAIQISISPALTAEPVLTPAERLRRLDAAIRDGLLEKQKIICDMFRLPVEHFHEIVDIAAMPEAPKDSADIALAAYAQVQTLTEVLNEYMHVTAEQQVSAVSTAVCDQCHEKQQQQQQNRQQGQPQSASAANNSPNQTLSTSSSSSSSALSAATQISNSAPADEQTPPPLPPPNKTQKHATMTPAPQIAQQQTPTPTAAKIQTPLAALEAVDADDACIHEDDDGYCEIDELRLPALPPHIAVAAAAAATQNKAAEPPPPPLPAPNNNQAAARAASPPELIKRQSTISTDSIPEESADDLNQADLEDAQEKCKQQAAAAVNDKNEVPVEDAEQIQGVINSEQPAISRQTTLEEKSEDSTATTEATEQNTKAEQEQAQEQHAQAAQETATIAVAAAANETASLELVQETMSNSNGLNATISTMEISTQTPPLQNVQNINGIRNINVNNVGSTAATAAQTAAFCGPNRIQHANSLEPTIPCHALNTIVGALNAQISLLLPKINERDMERERLRKENQHLRELLNAMHERQRVEDKFETPMHENNTAAAVAASIDKNVDEN